MSRKSIIVAGIVALLLAIGAIGYFSLKRTADDEIIRVVNQSIAGLPDGVSLTYDSLSSSPVNASVELKSVRLRDDRQNLTATADRVVARFSASQPPAADAEFYNVTILMEVPTPDGSRQEAFSAEGLSIRKMPLDWSERLLDGSEADTAAALADKALWRDLSLDEFMIEGFRSHPVDDNGDEVSFTIGRLVIGPVTGGVAEKVGLSDVLVLDDEDDGSVSIGTLHLTHLDLADLFAFSAESQAENTPEPSLPDDLFGLQDMAIGDLVVREAGETSLSVDRFAVTYRKQAATGDIQGVDITLKGFEMPPMRDGSPFTDATGLDQPLRLSGTIGVSLDDDKVLKVTPFDIDFHDLGRLEGRLEASNVDLALLNTVAEDPAPLLRTARLGVLTLDLQAARGTGALIDALARQGGMARGDLVATVNDGLRPQVAALFGREKADTMADAVVAFVQNPGRLAFALTSRAEPLTLEALSLGVLMAPQRVLDAYDLSLTHSR